MSNSFRHTARLFDAAFQANLERVFRSLRAARDSQRALLGLAGMAADVEADPQLQAQAMQSLELVEAGLADASRDLHGIREALGTTRGILLDDGADDPVQDEADRQAMEAACQLAPPAVRRMRIRQAEDDGDGVGMGF